MITMTNATGSRFLARWTGLLWLAVVIAGCRGESTPPVSQESLPESQPTVRQTAIYAATDKHRMESVLDAYRAETGRETRLMADDYPGIAVKVESHGRDPVPDLIIVGSLAELSAAAESDFFRPVVADSDEQELAGQLGDPDHYWTPLSYRARLVVYNQSLVDPEELADVRRYESLRAGQWQERLCLSSSKVPGNRSLIALLIRDHGVREAELIVRDWRSNMGNRFFANDVELVKAVLAGHCHVAIADTSIMLDFMQGGEDSVLAIHEFPGAAPVLVDVTAAGVARHAEDVAGATSLLEWLSEGSPNRLFATLGNEFPLSNEVAANSLLARWMHLVENPVQVSSIGLLHEDATALAERARFP